MIARDGWNRIGDLVDRSALSAAAAALLASAVQGDLNVAVAGPMYSGRTTLLGAVLLESWPNERWYCVERRPGELRLGDHGHLDVVELDAGDRPGLRPMSTVGARGRVALDDDRCPAAARALLAAVRPGKHGSWCTVHAMSGEAALRRLRVLCHSGGGLAVDAAASLVARWLDLVVVLAVEGRADGSRRLMVRSVSEVGESEGGAVVSREVCAPGRDGLAVPSAPLSASIEARLRWTG